MTPMILGLGTVGSPPLTEYSVSSRANGSTDATTLYDPVDYWTSTDAEDLYWGNKSAVTMSSALRFSGLSIPRGATITEAYITLWSAKNYSGCNSSTTWHTIGAEQVDNATAISSKSNFKSRRSNVDDTVLWVVEDKTLNSSLKSPNLKSLVQAIVDRVGWPDGTGGAINFFTEYSNMATPTLTLDPSMQSPGHNNGSSYLPLIEIKYLA